MDEILSLFPADMRVDTREDNLGHVCGYDVIGTEPEKQNVAPYGLCRVCIMPDGMDSTKKSRAEIIAAIPEMLDRISDHCEWCADCDWQNNPDQECRFGQLWKRLRGYVEESIVRNRHNVRREDIERMAREWEDWND